jgi:hypothetical protein
MQEHLKMKTFKVFYNGLSVIRAGWGQIFDNIGGKIDKENVSEFKTLFGNKFKNYMGQTYDVFQNKSIIPFFKFKPTEEAVEKTKEMFKRVAAQNGRPILI